MISLSGTREDPQILLIPPSLSASAKRSDGEAVSSSDVEIQQTRSTSEEQLRSGDLETRPETDPDR